MTATVHITGTVVDVGSRMRQCCAWCGTILLDADSAFGAAEVGHDPRPPHFPPGALLRVDGHVSAVVEHIDGDPLPDNACVNTETRRRAPTRVRVSTGEASGRDARRVLEALQETAQTAHPSNSAVITEALRCLGFPLDELDREIANVHTSISDAGNYFLEDKIRFRIEGELVRADETGA